MGKNRQGYNDEDKASALACLDANGGNVHRTARQLGLPDSTLDGWAKGRGISPAVPALREIKKGTLAEKFEEFAHRALDVAIEDEEGLRRAPVLQRVLAACAAVDKKLLLTGNPTQITAQADARRSAEQALERLFELAREKDPAITMEAVREGLCERRPELRPLLLE